jgi:hypothetical protein
MYNEFEMSGLSSSAQYGRLNTPTSAPAKNGSNGFSLVSALFFGSIMALGAYAGYQYLKTGKLRLPWDPKETNQQQGFSGPRYGVLFDRNA